MDRWQVPPLPAALALPVDRGRPAAGTYAPTPRASCSAWPRPGHLGADLWRMHRLRADAGMVRPCAIAEVALDRLIGALGLTVFVLLAGATLPPRHCWSPPSVSRSPCWLWPSSPTPPTRPPRGTAAAALRVVLKGTLLSVGYQMTIIGLLMGTVAAMGGPPLPRRVARRLRRQPGRRHRARGQRREPARRRVGRRPRHAGDLVARGSGCGSADRTAGLAAGCCSAAAASPSVDSPAAASWHPRPESSRPLRTSASGPLALHCGRRTVATRRDPARLVTRDQPSEGVGHGAGRGDGPRGSVLHAGSRLATLACRAPRARGTSPVALFSTSGSVGSATPTRKPPSAMRTTLSPSNRGRHLRRAVDAGSGRRRALADDH